MVLHKVSCSSLYGCDNYFIFADKKIIVENGWWWKFCAFSFVGPCTNLVIHANHIIFAFIHNQEHALSVGLFYGIILWMNVSIIRSSGNWFYKIDFYRDEKPWKRLYCKGDQEKKVDKNVAEKRESITIVISFFIISVVVWGLFAYIAAIYVLIPINNAFDQAPARVRLIYDSFLVGFAALFTYKFILKRKNKKTNHVKDIYDLLKNKFDS